MKITRRQLSKLISESLNEYSEKIKMLIKAGEIAQAVDLSQMTGSEYVDYPWETFSDRHDLEKMSSADLITIIEQLAGTPKKYAGIEELESDKMYMEKLLNGLSYAGEYYAKKAKVEGHTQDWIDRNVADAREKLQENISVQHIYMASKLSEYLQGIGYGPDVSESVMWHGKGYTIPIPTHIKEEVIDAYTKYLTNMSKHTGDILIIMVNFLEKYIDLETEKKSGISEPDGTVTSPTRSWPRGASGPQSRNYKYEDAIDAAEELDMLKKIK
jgi:hypothetical protein